MEVVICVEAEIVVEDTGIMEGTVAIEIIVIMVGTEVETEVALMEILIEEPSFLLFVSFCLFRTILTGIVRNVKEPWYPV